MVVKVALSMKILFKGIRSALAGLPTAIQGKSKKWPKGTLLCLTSPGILFSCPSMAQPELFIRWMADPGSQIPFIPGSRRHLSAQDYVFLSPELWWRWMGQGRGERSRFSPFSAASLFAGKCVECGSWCWWSSRGTDGLGPPLPSHPLPSPLLPFPSIIPTKV